MIVQSFVVVILGIVLGRLGVVTSTHAQGIEKYVTFIALPGLLLQALMTTTFKDVQWGFLGSILIVKVFLFLLTVFIMLTLSRPLNYGKAAIYGIFVTQSNDLALGYPICE